MTVQKGDSDGSMVKKLGRGGNESESEFEVAAASGYVMDVLCILSDRDALLSVITKLDMVVVAEEIDRSEFNEGVGPITCTFTLIGTGYSTDKMDELCNLRGWLYWYLNVEDVAALGLDWNKSEKFSNGLFWFLDLHREGRDRSDADTTELDPNTPVKPWSSDIEMEEQKERLAVELKNLAAQLQTTRLHLLGELARLSGELTALTSTYQAIQDRETIGQQLTAICSQLEKSQVDVNLLKIAKRIQQGGYDAKIPF